MAPVVKVGADQRGGGGLGILHVLRYAIAVDSCPGPCIKMGYVSKM